MRASAQQQKISTEKFQTGWDSQNIPSKDLFGKRTLQSLNEIYFGKEFYKEMELVTVRKGRIWGGKKLTKSKIRKTTKMKVKERTIVEKPFVCSVTCKVEVHLNNPERMQILPNWKHDYQL